MCGGACWADRIDANPCADSMDRLARSLPDLQAMVTDLTEHDVALEFLKEGLTFTGEDNAMTMLLLNVMGAFAEFKQALLLEHQREGIAIAKKAGVYKGRKPSLTPERGAESYGGRSSGA